MCDSPSVSCRASLWALSSCIVAIEPDADRNIASETYSSLRPLDCEITRAVKLAQQDDRVAANMPEAYEWLAPLSE
jgi:hypothetical protein